jgi:rhodanese-related sulfurtransferase
VKTKILNILISALFLFITAAFPKEASELAAEKSTFNFGEVQEGINVEVSFVVVNKGTQEARIREVRTFAACVEARPITKRKLAPGESLSLDYFFQSLGYGGAAVNKHIEIHYNNRKLSPLKLKVKGEVLPLESFQAPLGEMTYNFFVLVDIRSPERFAEEHIIGAINVPYQKIDQWVADVSKSISNELIIYLYSEDGQRSDEVAEELKEKGYAHFISIVGGLKEWKNQMGKKFLIPGKT